MSTLLQAPDASAGAGLPLFRMSIQQVQRMVDAGVLGPDDHVELLGGVLVAKMTKNPPHDYTTGRLAKLLEALLNPEEWIVREEKAVILGPLWRPEPDLAVARGPLARYQHVHPEAKDLGLLIEVTCTTHAADRLKWQGYAAARIPCYWMVDLDRRVVSVHARPEGRDDDASYRESRTYTTGEAIPVSLDGQEIGGIRVDDLLPARVDD